MPDSFISSYKSFVESGWFSVIGKNNLVQDFLDGFSLKMNMESAK